MALKGTEVQILRNGIDGEAVDRGAFVQNMLLDGRSWNVRKGWGQRAQFGVPLTANTASLSFQQENGYTDHLGSFIVETDFGHTQIVSVFVADVHTGDGLNPDALFTTGMGSRDYKASIYMVEVYDLTADRRWAEPLYRPTSTQQGGTTLPEDWHAHYETNLDRDWQSWLAPEDNPPDVSFVELNDVVYFASADIGLWAYRPIRCPERANLGSVDSVFLRNWCDPFGESATFVRVAAANGLYAEAYTYLTESLYPYPTVISELDGRLILADGRTVWFSDVGRPASVQSINYLIVPSEQDISAMTTCNGALFIFTQKETWYYQPSTGNIASGGRLTRVTSNVGCVGPNAVARTGSQLFWSDARGAYLSDGGYGISEVSKPISNLWDSFLTNPLTNYYPESGFSDLTLEQPPMRFDAAGVTKGVHVTYNAALGIHAVTYPSLGFSIILGKSGDKSGWSMWTSWTEATEDGGASVVGKTQNILHPWMLSDNQTLYMIGSVDEQTVADVGNYGGFEILPTSMSQVHKSYYLLEYGRGGALDRSIRNTYWDEAPHEDDRNDVHQDIAYHGQYGSWDNPEPSTIFNPQDLPILPMPQGVLYLERWLPVRNGMKVGTTGSPETLYDNNYLIPITYVPAFAGSGTNPNPIELDQIEMEFYFDNNNWRPALVGVTSDVPIILPPERQASSQGWTVEILGGPGGAPDPTGNVLHIAWDQAVAIFAGDVWTQNYPYMNLNMSYRNPLIYIPFRYIGTFDVGNAGIVPISISMHDNNTDGYAYPSAFVWQQGNLISQHYEDDVAQAVAWAYVSDNIGIREGTQMKARGAYLQVESHGDATTEIVPNWMFGTLNLAVGTDQRMWQTQTIDLTNEPPGVNVQEEIPSARPRVNSAGTMVGNVFEQAAAQWGSATVPATGTILIGDEQMGTVSSSCSSRGAYAQYMVFGHLRNRAESIKIGGIAASLRITGGRRRSGR